MNIESFLSSHGIEYAVSRDGHILSTEIGLANHEKATGKPYIGFRPHTDIKPGDCLINPVGEKVFVIDTQTAMFSKQPHQLKAYYETKVEHNRPKTSIPNTVFNISSASNSIIGHNTGNTIIAACSLSDLDAQAENYPEDKEEIREIIDLLTSIANSTVKPEKGLLAKFSGIMEKHSWLSSSVASFLLNFLTNI